ncbi:hypothetical protein CspeluHIS016_0505150 [Cutaneotrichosporon spelunceum]|uniref:Glycosyltransferase 61 catalytic domain-containing protein n=1 Tax=Cutaneotrichosporon spelunceum TaxID=1672016 RepID=A0AAD3TX41_9TREE|nr:hypothetical protein CspeluHIS016_0505150 [Cutaneotrichosporon spelunceum]
MGWHVTRSHLLVALSVLVLFGLFLQLDLSFRFTDSRGSNSLLGLKLGIGGGRHSVWDSSSRHGYDENSPLSSQAITVSDVKVKWGAEGAPRTSVLAHAPGWTVLDDVYLFNGTWYVVTDNPSSIPLRRMMISTGAEIWNDQASINRREPTEKEMRIIFPSEANRLWGHSVSRVADTTFLVNDPPQFLDHYYHFAAELLFGIWRTYSSLDPSINAAGETQLPGPARVLFPFVNAGGWNDYAKMNSFLMRAIFPSISFEYRNDWTDRVDTERPFKYDRVVIADRAAAFRGPEFAKTWRTASEAATLGGSRYWWAPVRRNLLQFVGSGTKGKDEINLADYGVGVDDYEEYGATEVSVLDADNSEEEDDDDDEEPVARRGHDKNGSGDGGKRGKPGRRGVAAQQRGGVHKTWTPSMPVITYVSRQDWGRRMLLKEDHDVLVKELGNLGNKYGWEINIVAMDKLTRDEQIRLAARTTIMMGVHGNGLTHLIWMNNLNPRATVMEFFYPAGFAEDYEFTSRALGIRHYGWWGHESFTYPNTPPVAYPEGFQGNEIPIDGKAVAQLCEQRLLVDRVAGTNEAAK